MTQRAPQHKHLKEPPPAYWSTPSPPPLQLFCFFGILQVESKILLLAETTVLMLEM